MDAVPPSQPALRAERLTKDFGGGRGILDLDLTVQRGEVFGFLGPNGAGKTTTMRLLMGLARPTRGSATIFGLDCWSDAVAVKRFVGYVPGDLPDWDGLRGAEVVATLAALRGRVDDRHVARLAERLDLDLGRPWPAYSRGNKQKLALLLAFMHRPALLVLDEPTSGLDPLVQQTFFALLADARAEGATVFLSSHVLSEVQHVAGRVGIVNAGHLVAVAGLDELRRLQAHRVEVIFDGAPPEALVRATPGVEDVVLDGPRLTCTVRGRFDDLLGALAGQPVVALESHEPTLEELFLAYYRDEAAP